MENILEIPFNCVFGFDASLEFNFGYRANRVAIPYSVRLCADLTEGDIVPVSAALERDDDVPCSMHIKLVSPEVPFVPYADAENYLEALLVFWAAPDTFIESGSARYLLTVTDEAGQQHETSIQLQITGTDPVISVQTRTSEPDVDSKETSIEFEPGKSFAEETVIIKNHTYGGAPLLIHVVVSDGAGGVFSLGLNSEQVDECISKKVASGRSFSFTARFKLLPEITMLGAYYGCALIKFALALPKEGFLGHDTELHQFYDHVLSFQACMIANESASHEVIPCPSLSAHEDEDLTGHDSFCSQEDEHPEEVCLGYALGLRSGNEPESCGKNDGCYEPQEGDGDLEISSQLQKEGDGGCDLIPHISEPMSSLPVLIDERVLEPMPENLENLPYMVCNVSIDQPPTWIQSGRHARDGSEYDGEAQESVEEHSDLDRLCSAEKPQLVEEVSKPAMTTKDGREANNLEEWNKQATNSEKHVREALSSFHHNSAHEEIPTDLNQPAGMQVGSRVELETDVEPGEIVEGASVPPGGPGRSSTASERVRDIVEYLRACESDSTPSEHEDTSDLKPTSRNNESGNESILKPKEGPFESAATSSDARTSSVAPVTTGHPEESIASSGKYSPGALPEDERRVARKFFNPKTNFTPKVSLGENSQSISENAGGKPVESYDSVQDLVADDSRIGKSIRKVFKKDFKPKLKMPPWIRDGGIRIPADSGTIRLPILSASPSMIEVSVSVKSLSRQRNPATVNPNFFVLNTNQTTKISISRTSAAEGKLLLIMQCSPAKGPRLRRTYEVPLFIEQSFVHVPAAQGFAVDRPALTFYNPDESSQNCRVRVLNGTSTPTQYKLWIGNARKGQRAAFKVQSTKRGFIEPQECVGIQVAYRGSKDVEYHRDKLYIKVGDSMDILPLFGYTGYSDVRFSVTLHGRIRARNYGTRYGFVALSGPEVDSPENELIKTVLGPEQACEFEPPYGTGTLIYTGDEIARSRMCYAHELMKPPTESRGSPDVECMFAGEFEGEEQAQCDEQLVWDKDTKHSLHYAGRLLDSNVKRYGFDVDTERIVLLPDAGRGQDSKWHASVDESGIVHIENYDSKEELSFAVQGAEPRFGTVPALGDAVVAAFAENICIKARGRTLELEIPKAS